MFNTISDLLSAYRATPETLQTLLRYYSPENVITAGNGEEGWSVVEVICHLRDSEEASLKRTRLMRNQTNPQRLPRNS